MAIRQKFCRFAITGQRGVRVAELGPRDHSRPVVCEERHGRDIQRPLCTLYRGSGPIRSWSKLLWASFNPEMAGRALESGGLVVVSVSYLLRIGPFQVSTAIGATPPSSPAFANIHHRHQTGLSFHRTNVRDPDLSYQRSQAHSKLTHAKQRRPGDR